MFEPENELGVIVLFAQQCAEAGFEILSIRAAFPDALVRRGGVEYRVEFEYLSSNFYQHGHDPRNADFIICWQHNTDCVLPVLALSEPEWQQREIVLPSQIERALDYWKRRALRAECQAKQLKNEQAREMSIQNGANGPHQLKIQLIKTLDITAREKVWLLRKINDDMKQKDIANALGISPSYVSSSLKEQPDELDERLTGLIELYMVGEPSSLPTELESEQLVPVGSGNGGNA